jgi:hypothetical protein
MSVTFTADSTNLEKKQEMLYWDAEHILDPYIWLNPGQTEMVGGITYTGSQELHDLVMEKSRFNDEELAMFPIEVQNNLRSHGRAGETILDPGPSVNLANANGRVILDIMGYNSYGEDDLYGSADPADFIKKCQTALQSNLSSRTIAPSDSHGVQGIVDTDDPSITMENGVPIRSDGRARMVSQGIDQNYLIRTLNRLIDLGMWCLRKEEQLNVMPEGVVPLRKTTVKVMWG